MDKGTEDKVVDVVRNLVFHLKKGYMIVKCRGQQEIQDQLSLSEALQREKIFFQDHPYFRCACLGFIMDQSKPRMSGLPGDNGSHPTDVWSVCVCVRACVCLWCWKCSGEAAVSLFILIFARFSSPIMLCSRSPLSVWRHWGPS